MTFKDNLKELRQKENKTQKEMAQIMEVSERMYQMYEKGQKEPTISKVINLKNRCNADLNKLLQE